jgi:hypothetical protein
MKQEDKSNGELLLMAAFVVLAILVAVRFLHH